MKNLDFRIEYIRHLPHIQPPGATLFVTYRLARSIPYDAKLRLIAESERIDRTIAQLKNGRERDKQAAIEYRRLFGKWDNVLDTTDSGPQWLSNPEVAKVVVDSLHYLNGKKLDLDTYCLMSNHVHVIMTPLALGSDSDEYYALQAIMHSHKRYTAILANRILDRQGQFWQHESYDHVVRDDAELQRIRNYVLNNPVKAGLVDCWQEWPWSYCKYS